MNIRIISIIIMLFALSISLFGCGVSSPTGTTGFGSANSGVRGITGVSFSAIFPTHPPAAASGLNALMSASTATIDIWIYDGAGNLLSFGSVTNASSSTTIPVTGYTGPIKVCITSYDSAWNSTGWHIHDAYIYPGMTTPISIALVEFNQGAVVTGTLTAPDGALYTLNSIFLLPIVVDYQLGVDVGAAGAAYHISSQNLDQATPNGVDPPNIVLYVVNDKLTFPIDVPNASKTVWNRYQIDINFMNGFDQFGNPIPTNTPNITGVFMGTFTHDINSNVVPATGTTPGAVGTMVINAANATWVNNMAPATIAPIAF